MSCLTVWLSLCAELTFADPIEHATGIEKVMLLLEERGIDVSISCAKIRCNNVDVGPVLSEPFETGSRDKGQPEHHSVVRIEADDRLYLRRRRDFDLLDVGA